MSEKKPHVSEPMKSLAEATEVKSFKHKLVEARKNMANPKRGGTDNFKKRKYVTLQDIYDATLPSLLEEYLTITNFKDYRKDKFSLVTRIEDADSDEFIETFSPLNESLKIQEQGAEITYYSRYNLGCLLSIRTDFDDDAESIKDKTGIKSLVPLVNNLISKLIGVQQDIFYSWVDEKHGHKDFSKLSEADLKSIISKLEKQVVKNINNGV